MARNTRTTCSSSWFASTANFLSIFTFLMVATIFITGIIVAVNISVSIEKGQVFINELMKYVKEAEKVLKTQSARIKTYVKQHDISENVRTGAEMVKQKTVDTSQKIKNERRPSDEPEYDNYDFMM